MKNNARSSILSSLYLPVTFLYLEICVRVATPLPFSVYGLLSALALGMLLTAVLSFLPKKPWRFAVTILLAEAAVVWFLIAYFTNDTYSVFMDPDIIFGTAGNVVEDFSDMLLNVIKGGIWKILLFHIPVIAGILFRKCFLPGTVRIWVSLILLVISLLIGAFSYSNCRMKQYNYDDSIRKCGVISSLEQFFEFISDKTSASTFQYAIPASPEVTAAPETEEAAEEEEPAPEYEPHVMDLPFDKEGNENIQAINNYIQSLSPSKKNAYTGLLKGKNLIVICAESFTKEVISEELTPTLYFLQHHGIVLEDFYHPFWGGSTTTGEYSLLTGLVPPEQNAMLKTIGKNMYFTIGNQLRRAGYASHAYHNGSVTYYDRDKTHPNLGYDEYIALGNGMENHISYRMNQGGPAKHQSDQEMFEYTVPLYIEEQPFSVYYMTISGHSMWSRDGNEMTRKNWDAVKDLDNSEVIRSYIAANLEVEYAVKFLMDSLEEAGKLDDTVIVICPDHYPYNLVPNVATNTVTDYLAELYGYHSDTCAQRDHNVAMIWSPCLDELEEKLVISTPCSSLDILPTLSNLFDLDYDSRLFVGRDLLDPEAAPLVMWSNASWLTDRGFYDAGKEEFTPAKGQTADQNYIDSINQTVANKISFSASVLYNDYYDYLFGSIAEP